MTHISLCFLFTFSRDGFFLFSQLSVLGEHVKSLVILTCGLLMKEKQKIFPQIFHSSKKMEGNSLYLTAQYEFYHFKVSTRR